MVHGLSTLVLSVIFVGCCAVPISRPRRQISPYVIERIEDREWNYESDKFNKPIEEFPNRDREIRVEAAPAKPALAEAGPRHPEPTEDRDPGAGRASSREAVSDDTKYADSVEDFEFSVDVTTPSPSGSSPVEHDRAIRRQQGSAARGRATPAPAAKSSRPPRTHGDAKNHRFEATPRAPGSEPAVAERDAEQIFLEGISDKVQAQYAEKKDGEPGASRVLVQRPAKEGSSAKKGAGDAASGRYVDRAEGSGAGPAFGAKGPSGRQVHALDAEPESAEDELPHELEAASDEGEHPESGEHEHPADERQTKFAEPNPPEDARVGEPRPSTPAEEEEEGPPGDGARGRAAPAPRKPARRPPSRSHSALRSSSEELSRLVEEQDPEMEKDLVNQSQSEKSSSIVQRSPNDDSEEDKDKIEDAEDEGEDVKEEESARSSVDDILLNLYPSDENMTQLRNTFSTMFDSFINLAAVMNFVRAVNNVQPLMNVISRFAPTN